MSQLGDAVKAGQVAGVSAADWASATEQWQSVLQAVKAKQLKPAEAIARHTRLIEGHLALMDHVLFDSQLILDPTPDGYSLVTLAGQFLPMQAERLGQLRGRGTTALSAGAIKPEEAATLVGLLAQARSAGNSVNTALKHAVQADPSLKAELQPLAEKAASELTRLGDLVQKELLESDDLRLDANQFYADATQAIDAQFKFLESATSVLERQLTARTTALRNRTLAVAAGLVALFALTVWTATLIANNLLRGFRHAVRVSEALARGELDTPIDIQGRDEVAQMLGAMATTQVSLRDIVQEVRQGVEGVSSASAQIAQGNADLKARTQKQAVSAARTSSTMPR